MKKISLILLSLNIILIGTGALGTSSYASMMNSNAGTNNYSGGMIGNYGSYATNKIIRKRSTCILWLLYFSY